MDDYLIIDPVSMCHITEQTSRIQTQIGLIKKGNTHTNKGECRLEIIAKCSKDIYAVLRSL